MIRGAALTFLLTLTVFGCRTAENVASTSAAVVTAPVHLFRHGEQPTTETTVYEGQPVEAHASAADGNAFAIAADGNILDHHFATIPARRDATINCSHATAERDAAEFLVK